MFKNWKSTLLHKDEKIIKGITWFKRRPRIGNRKIGLRVFPKITD